MGDNNNPAVSVPRHGSILSAYQDRASPLQPERGPDVSRRSRVTTLVGAIMAETQFTRTLPACAMEAWGVHDLFVATWDPAHLGKQLAAHALVATKGYEGWVLSPLSAHTRHRVKSWTLWQCIGIYGIGGHPGAALLTSLPAQSMERRPLFRRICPCLALIETMRPVAKATRFQARSRRTSASYLQLASCQAPVHK